METEVSTDREAPEVTDAGQRASSASRLSSPANSCARRCLPWILESVRRGGVPAITVFAIHLVAAIGLDAYSRYPSLDIPMHYLGGVAIAYFFHRASLAASSYGIIGPFHRVTHLVLVFALTCTTAMFWEFSEYLTDRFLGTGAQLGLEDTLSDMALGVCGGITVLIVTALTFRSPKA